MNPFDALKHKFKTSAHFLARQMEDYGPSAGLTKVCGKLEPQEHVSLRTWLLGGACLAVLTVAAVGCVSAPFAAGPVVAGGGVVHVVTQLDYFEPIRHDAKSFFTVIGISNALLLAATSVINVRGQYRAIASLKEGTEIARPLVSRTALKAADLVRHAGTGAYWVTCAFKKLRSWRRPDDPA